MVGQKSPTEAYDAFNRADGIEISGSPDEKEILVKVMAESAVGEFFQICREHNVERSAISRKYLDYTVMSSWVRINE